VVQKRLRVTSTQSWCSELPNHPDQGFVEIILLGITEGTERITNTDDYIHGSITTGTPDSTEHERNATVMHETCEEVSLLVKPEKDKGPTTRHGLNIRTPEKRVRKVEKEKNMRKEGSPIFNRGSTQCPQGNESHKIIPLETHLPVYSHDNLSLAELPDPYRCSIGSCNRLGYRLGEGQMSF